MAAIGTKIRSQEGGRIAFLCPGCDDYHAVIVDGSRGWSWNGDGDRPTIMPSILVRSGHYLPGHENRPCWCTYYRDHPDENNDDGFKCSVCHSSVADGRIQYLTDCTHALAGQTVDLPDWREEV